MHLMNHEGKLRFLSDFPHSNLFVAFKHEYHVTRIQSMNCWLNQNLWQNWIYLMYCLDEFNRKVLMIPMLLCWESFHPLLNIFQIFKLSPVWHNQISAYPRTFRTCSLCHLMDNQESSYKKALRLWKLFWKLLKAPATTLIVSKISWKPLFEFLDCKNKTKLYAPCYCESTITNDTRKWSFFPSETVCIVRVISVVLWVVHTIICRNNMYWEITSFSFSCKFYLKSLKSLAGFGVKM